MVVIESKFVICFIISLSQNKNRYINKHCYYFVRTKFGDEKRTAIACMFDDVVSILTNHYGNIIKVVEKRIHSTNHVWIMVLSVACRVPFCVSA